MLFKLHTNIFIIALLTIGFMAVIVKEKAMSIITLGAMIAFVTQMGLLLYFSQKGNNYYSEKTLFSTVLIYDILLATCFMLISEYYDGDTFMLSKTDAMLYYTESMNTAEVGFIEGGKHMMERYKFDNWGALFFDSFLMYILPNKLFLNIVYILLGAIASVLLFRIGRPLMPDVYAFLAALAYGTSSYLVFFNCTFLKESLFMFFIVLSIYHLYNAINEQASWALVSTGFSIGMLLFFRPAVAAFIVVSIFIYYSITQRGNAISLFLYAISGAMLVASFAFMQESVDAYTAGGDIDAVIAYRSNGGYSSSFNYFVCFFGAFFGPFPTMFSKSDIPSRIVFYGAGLTYKLFLILPFWYCVYLALKDHLIKLAPMILFIVLEMTATAYVCASLELRKVMMHIPFMYVLSFYALSKWETSGRPIHIPLIIGSVIAIGILFLWNVIKL